MKIFNNQPLNWKDLQVKVSNIFSDLKYIVEIEKNIHTVRGIVNIDVHCENSSINPKEIVISECKHWNSAVPKSVVHSFRTVVSDYGANAGYLISKEGFQSGAYEAAKNSNIFLMSFDEFQENFKIRWVSSMIKNLQKSGYHLYQYSKLLGPHFDEELKLLSEEKQKKFWLLHSKYSELSIYSLINNYTDILSGELDLEFLEYRVNDIQTKLPKNVQVNCLYDYFHFLMNFYDEGVKEFDTLFGQQLRRQ